MFKFFCGNSCNLKRAWREGSLPKPSLQEKNQKPCLARLLIFFLETLQAETELTLIQVAIAITIKLGQNNKDVVRRI